MDDVGRLVALPPVRDRRQIGGVGFEHHIAERHARHDLGQCALLIGNDASYAEQEIAARRKEADAEAEKNAEATLDDARKRAEKILSDAEEEAKREKVKAVAAIKGEVAEVAVLIASGILDKEITAEENAKIIDDCLKEWDENNE